jgi:hypothetical protein
MDFDPGVALRFTPGFMLTPAPRLLLIQLLCHQALVVITCTTTFRREYEPESLRGAIHLNARGLTSLAGKPVQTKAALCYFVGSSPVKI